MSTRCPDIHRRAEELVRESRGRINLREAYKELGRRGARAKKRPKYGKMPWPQYDLNNTEDRRPYRLPYVDN